MAAESPSRGLLCGELQVGFNEAAAKWPRKESWGAQFVESGE